jgi:peptidyl-prolyl cis-trans isomerase A (cyclophilin A)
VRLALLFVLTACDAGVPPPKPAPKPAPPKPASIDAPPLDRTVRPPTKADLDVYLKAIPGPGDVVATIRTTEGTLHCDLYPELAPVTVANFIGLATGMKAWMNPSGSVEVGKPFYDGLTFHRVIPEFMIQGGDPAGRGTGGPGYTFDDEPTESPFGPGSLAMANAGTASGHGTNGSQFFIMDGTRADLAHQFTLFGHCANLDVVKRIARVPRDRSDRPTSPVTITRITFSRVLSD